MHKITWEYLGVFDYKKAYKLQESLACKIKESGALGHLLLLTHPKTFTTGKRSLPEHLLTDKNTLKSLGFDFVKSNRGGLITYHGPGQLVVYPILNLELLQIKGVKDYVKMLEQVLLDLLTSYNVNAKLIEKHPGVFVGHDKTATKTTAKIASIGIHVSGNITTHGLSLNIAPRLSDYKHICACGLKEHGVTSLLDLGIKTNITEVIDRFVPLFAKTFNANIEQINL